MLTRNTTIVALLALIVALLLPTIVRDRGFVVMHTSHRLLTAINRFMEPDARNISAEQLAAESLLRGFGSLVRCDSDDATFIGDFRRYTSTSSLFQAQPPLVPGAIVSEIKLDSGAGPRALLIIDESVQENKRLSGKCVSQCSSCLSLVVAVWRSLFFSQWNLEAVMRATTPF